MPSYTPAMQQYIDIKKKHQDCILFFRIWDFYETFFDDAKTVSKVLDLILTSKNKNAENPIPMAGIPHHSIDKYLKKLIENDYKIAIAEQTTLPQAGKIVEREVVSIITPWTYIQEVNKNFNFLISIIKKTYKNWDNYHISRGDFTIWEYQTKSFKDINEMQDFIIQLKPKEIIFDIDFPEKNELKIKFKEKCNCLISIYDIPVDPKKFITNECKIQDIISFGKALEDGKLYASALLLNYLKNTQKTQLTNIVKIWIHNQNNKITLDNITIKNLEIFSSSYENQEKYSLIGVLDNTKTTGGARLLRYILANPQNDINKLNQRLENIEYYQNKIEITKNIHNILWNIIDIPKIISTILYRKLLASTFARLRTTLDIFFPDEIKNKDQYAILLPELLHLKLSETTAEKIKILHNKLTTILKPNEDLNDEINFINDGYKEKIDELRKIAFHSDQLLINYQQELIKKSWVQNIKIKFIRNQWYFIEITNKDIETFEKNLLNPEEENEKYNLIRRSTLKWAQRYTSPYINNLEQKIFSSKEKLIQEEFLILEELKNKIGNISKELNEFSQKISRLDLFTSQAILAKQKQFCKPKLTTNWQIKITNGRHPVIEKFLPIDQQFIPNNLDIWDYINTKNKEIKNDLHIITGPNMGWKSTFLRQNAIIVLMAHCWLFIPAKWANISIVDGIFARVGSWDIIAQNQSTFMTEMIEVASILNNATTKSFIIFDELGRWTSTYDWLALTKAILEYLATKIKSKTLIATHYHELIELEKIYPNIKNYSVSVYETNKEVIFMKKIIEGWANKSYWIDVAKLAWLNKNIIQKAEQNLKDLNKNLKNSPHFSSTTLIPNNNSISDPKFEKIKTLINSFDINNMTPLQAMQLLAKIKNDL